MYGVESFNQRATTKGNPSTGKPRFRPRERKRLARLWRAPGACRPRRRRRKESGLFFQFGVVLLERLHFLGNRFGFFIGKNLLRVFEHFAFLFLHMMLDVFLKHLQLGRPFFRALGILLQFDKKFLDDIMFLDAFEGDRSEEHTSELQSRENLVCRLLLEKKNKRE